MSEVYRFYRQYTVQSGDTLISLLGSSGMSRGDFLTLNQDWQRDWNREVKPGEVVLLRDGEFEKEYSECQRRVRDIINSTGMFAASWGCWSSWDSSTGCWRLRGN